MPLSTLFSINFSICSKLSLHNCYVVLEMSWKCPRNILEKSWKEEFVYAVGILLGVPGCEDLLLY